MAAMTEDQQMAAAIAASMTLNNPTAKPTATTTTTTSTKPSSAPSTGATKTESAPKKGKKMKILRFMHSKGLHRMPKVDFTTVTLGRLKERLVTDMALRVDPKTLIIKLNKTADLAWDTQWDSQTLTELGISKNGQKLWLEFPEPKLKPLWKGFGSSFVGGGMTRIGTERLASAEVIGVYFSAHWCPPCRAFTPKLVKTYNAMKDRGCPIEILFISADHSQDEMESYFATMPWVAGQSTHELKEVAGTGIPELIFFKTDGTLITKDGTTLVGRDPSGGAIMRAAGL